MLVIYDLSVLLNKIVSTSDTRYDMDANGLLTFFAILIAAFTLVAEERRTDFKIRFSWWDWVVLISLAIGVLIIIYSPVILAVTSVTPVGWYFGFTKETVIFTLLVISLIYCSLKFFGDKIPKRNHRKLAGEMMVLLKEKRFSILAYIINRHHVTLLEAVQVKYWHDYLREKINPPLNFSLDQESVPRTIIDRMVGAVSVWFLKCLPKNNKSKDVLRDAIRLCFKSQAFLRYLAGVHTLVAAKFVSSDLLLKSNEVSNGFFTYLISMPDSPFSRELRDNQNCSYTGEFYIDESNELLQYYLSDVRVSERNEIWNPIANYVIAQIKSQKDKSGFYNAPDENFSSSDQRWACPIFRGIFFFQLMVSAAIFQKVKNHMWLSYYSTFSKEIINSMVRHDSVDISSEFPCRFDYLLYEIFSNTCKWVVSGVYVAHAEDCNSYPEYEAARSAGQQFRNMFCSHKATDFQKVYFLEELLGTIELLDSEGRKDLSSLMYTSTLSKYEGGSMDNMLVDVIFGFFKRIDPKYNNVHSSFVSELTLYYKKMHSNG